jgi:hypothetical protein
MCQRVANDDVCNVKGETRRCTHLVLHMQEHLPVVVLSELLPVVLRSAVLEHAREIGELDERVRLQLPDHGRDGELCVCACDDTGSTAGESCGRAIQHRWKARHDAAGTTCTCCERCGRGVATLSLLSTIIATVRWGSPAATASSLSWTTEYNS